MEYCDGSVYEGAFSLGRRHGKGIWAHVGNTAGVASYSGDWVYDMRDGNGEVIYSTGDKYIGPLVAGQPHGAGKMVLSNGMIFEAKFTNGMMNDKVDMTGEKGQEVVSLGPDGQVIGSNEGVEVLVPPFVPALPY